MSDWLRWGFNKAQRVMVYFTPMPEFPCQLPTPKPLIAGFTHRLPIELDVSSADGAVERDDMAIRIRWIAEDGREIYGGQTPILRGIHPQSSVRVIATIEAPPEPGIYSLAVFLVRGRWEKPLAQSGLEWSVIPLEETDGIYNYGEYMIGLDASTRCNLECIFCLRTFLDHGAPEQINPEELAKLAAGSFDGCSGISLSLGAEPLLNTRFPELVDALCEYPYTRSTMTSNGTPLSAKLARLLVAKQYEEICVSIDGVKKETFESIRVGADFNQVIDNLKRLKAYKEEYNSPYPNLKFHFAMMRRNIEELPAFIDLAQDLDVSGIRLQYFMIPHESLTDECLWFEPEKSNRFLSEAIQKCEAYGIPIDAPPLFDPERKADRKKKLRTQRCHWPWKGILLGSKGEVTPCCQWKGPSLGNINEESFEAVWNGEGYRQLRRDWISGKLNKYCRDCSALLEGDVNDFHSFIAAEYELINGKKAAVPNAPVA